MEGWEGGWVDARRGWMGRRIGGRGVGRWVNVSRRVRVGGGWVGE